MPEEFSLSTPYGDIYGTIKPSKRLVVFSHGFGVNRHSRGLFTAIVSELDESWGYILFDYNNIEIIDDKEHVTLRSYSDQVVALMTVLRFARDKADDICLVGHSMGCMTISLLADPAIHHVLLLAPPVGTTSGRRYFNEYQGASRDSAGTLVIPRKDGTITPARDSFWDDAEKYFPPDVYKAYSKLHNLAIIKADDEDVLKHTENYELLRNIKGIELLSTPGDHNFSGSARIELVRMVNRLIKQ